MRSRFPKLVRTQSGSIVQDACMLISAENVAMGYGTFVPSLCSLSPRAQNLYVPFTTGFFPSVLRWSVRERGVPAARVYTFPGYVTTWKSMQDRFAKMRNYPEANVSEAM